MERDEGRIQDADWIAAADHDAGFKEVLVLFKNGESALIKVFAIPSRQYLRLAMQFRQMADEVAADHFDYLDALAKAALVDPETGKAVADLNKLTPTSYETVVCAADYLAIGYREQKKRTEVFRKILAQHQHQPQPSPGAALETSSTEPSSTSSNSKPPACDAGTVNAVCAGTPTPDFSFMPTPVPELK